MGIEYVLINKDTNAVIKSYSDRNSFPTYEIAATAAQGVVRFMEDTFPQLRIFYRITKHSAH